MEIKSTTSFRPEKTSRAFSKTTSKQKSQKPRYAPRLDTFESSASKPFGSQMRSLPAADIVWDGAIPSLKTLDTVDPDFFIRDDVDWKSAENSFTSGATISLDNADSLESTINHISSLYLAARHRLEQAYAGRREDKLSEGMERLNAMFCQAKNRLTSSFKNSVGPFYETIGGKDIALDMENSLTAAIDKRVEEIQQYGNETGLLDPEKDYSYSFLETALQTYGINQENKATLETSPKDGQKGYSLKALQAAGFVAKSAAAINAKEWSLMGDEELRLSMKAQYIKMSFALGRFGIGEKMSSLLLDAIGSFLNQFYPISADA